MNRSRIVRNTVFRHPTHDYVVSEPELTPEAIVVTITYSDGTIAKRYEYQDGRPPTIFVNKLVTFDPKTNEAYVAE